MIDVKNNQSLCVYSQSNDNKIETKVFVGSCKYIPTPNDFKFEQIDHITIPENQYIKIEYPDGKIEHIKGPSIFHNDKHYV